MTIFLDKTPFCGYSKYMNKLSTEKRTQVITALVEGCSINATSRMTGVAKNTMKVENLAYALALYFMYYNFARVHETIRCTPAMEAGVADYVWTIQEIVGLADREKSN